MRGVVGHELPFLLRNERLVFAIPFGLTLHARKLIFERFELPV